MATLSRRIIDESFSDLTWEWSQVAGDDEGLICRRDGRIDGLSVVVSREFEAGAPSLVCSC